MFFLSQYSLLTNISLQSRNSVKVMQLGLTVNGMVVPDKDKIKNLI